MPTPRDTIRTPVFCILQIAALTVSLAAQPAEQDIRGPKDLVKIPIPPASPLWLWYAIGGGILLIILIAILWKKRRQKQFFRSPSQIALAALTELERTPQPIADEEFANQAAHAVRHYISARFGLAAPRRTTEEFLRDLMVANESPVIAESDHLKAFLKSCDLAKFAGSHLSSTQRDALVEAARNFITVTSKPATP